MAVATPAATMVIFRRDALGCAPMLLMVERTTAMAFAGGAAVFPGGKVDSADFEYAAKILAEQTHDFDVDEAAARLAAIRETLEEAGLALGLHGVADPSDCAEARAALHAGETLEQICQAHGWQPDLARLIPWARWRPPARESRTFDTRFYLIDAGDADLQAEVDQTENHALFWASAAQALEYAEAGKIKIIFPTHRNLERLALFDSYSNAAAHAAEFPVSTVHTYIDERANGRWLCIPDGHGYPVIEQSMDSVKRG